MLPFGSLLTQIPLLIIGALYMLYLGLCAVNMTKSGDADVISDAKEQFIDKTYSVKAADFSTLAHYYKEKNKDYAEKSKSISIYDSYTEIPFSIPDDEISIFLAGYFHSSRPPPPLI